MLIARQRIKMSRYLALVTAAWLLLSPVLAQAATSPDPITLLKEYLSQQRVSVEEQNRMAAQLQEALQSGADAQQVTVMLQLMIRERVQVRETAQFTETIRELAREGKLNLQAALQTFQEQLQEGKKAKVALEKALEAAKEAAEHLNGTNDDQDDHNNADGDNGDGDHDDRDDGEVHGGGGQGGPAAGRDKD